MLSCNLQMVDDQDEPIRQIADSLRQEYQDLTLAIKKLELRRSRVRAALLPLIAIEDDQPAEFTGSLADACRLVLQHRGGKSMTPQEVRDAVKALGYDLGKHDNVMATIHGVLKSLYSQREVKTAERTKEPGTVRYYWEPDQTAPKLIRLSELSRLGAMWPGLAAPEQPSGELLKKIFGDSNPLDITEQLGMKPKK